jgi:hypothetical protein
MAVARSRGAKRPREIGTFESREALTGLALSCTRLD